MKKLRTRRARVSLFLIFAGVLVILAVAAQEAYRYPWATVFGGGRDDDSALPDPPPIVWDNGDREAAPSSSGVSSSAPSSAASSSAAILPGDGSGEDAPPAGYTELGTIKIPKLSLSQHVLEGTQKQMHYGVGHVTGTAPLGGSGNCALAGHNTTSFHYLSKLAAGDRVILKAGGNVYTYTVFKSFTVLPTDVSVLNRLPDESAALTLITCTPYMISTHRLIVRARLTDVNGSAVSPAPQPGFSAASELVPAGGEASALR